MTIPRIAPYVMPAQWPASRVQWPLQAHRAALLVHDMQAYFLDFYDTAQAPVPTLLAHVRQLIDQAHALGIPVFFSAQPHQQSPEQRGLLQAMWGPGLTTHAPEVAQIHPAVAPAPGDVVLTKWRYSAFQRSDLAERLDALDRDQLLVCGVYAHIGCLMSAAEAFMKDIQPFFVADALADFSAQEHAQALDYVAQRCGRVLGTAQALAELAPAVPEGEAPALRPPASLADWMTQLHRLLQLPEGSFTADDALTDWGLDSIRLMAIVEMARQSGLSLGFPELAQAASARDQWQRLSAKPMSQAA
ncbi:MAG: isochorismatase family protein [Burkholderiaceae bacterium]|nr:MAG: isochorismatase family protein [Burkholderiaceae bacterium]